MQEAPLHLQCTSTIPPPPAKKQKPNQPPSQPFAFADSYVVQKQSAYDIIGLLQQYGPVTKGQGSGSTLPLPCDICRTFWKTTIGNGCCSNGEQYRIARLLRRYCCTTARYGTASSSVMTTTKRRWNELSSC